ncbi:MAG TPA: hypothetical protein VK524_15335 [Polyangiaceae bacterium]|nr:hypothetical protein [Polyangiaceae bacterium]
MNAAELEHRELVTLLSTLGLMARLDGEASSEEADFLEQIAREVGDERFGKAATEAAQFADAEAIVRAAAQVTRPEARELIFALLFDMAVRESIVAREAELLDRLATIWGLPQRAGA